MKKFIPFLIFCAVELAVCMSPIAYTPKLVLAILGIAAFLFYRRQIFLYLHGNDELAKGHLDKAFKYYEKALKAHVNEEGELSIANAYVVHGDIRRGREILAHFESRKLENPNNIHYAKMLEALLDWREGKIQEAIDALVAIKNGGWENTTLLTNLMVMYLDQDMVDEAEQIWREASESEKQDLGIRDLRGRILIAQGKWDDAYKLYVPMLKEPQKLVNELVHAMQVFVHYGMIKEALICLEAAKDGPFNKINPYSKDYLNDLYTNLQGSTTRLRYAHAVDANPAKIASGKPYELPRGTFPSSEGDTMEGFTTLPKNLRSLIKKAKEDPDTAELLKDDVMPDTDLDESDEEYLKEKDAEEEKSDHA